MKKQEIIGKKFGEWTVFDVKRVKNRTCALCICSCGTEKFVRVDGLMSHKSISCGCLASIKAGRDSAVKALYQRYKIRAKKKELKFTLSFEKFKLITKQNCLYCGTPPRQKATTKSGKDRLWIYNGIDRINNNKGYTKDNVAPCCKHCNVAKGTMDKQCFISHIKQTYKHIIATGQI